MRLSDHQRAARATCAVEFRAGCDIHQAWERVQAKLPNCDRDTLTGMAALYAATIPSRKPAFRSEMNEKRILAYLAACLPAVAGQCGHDQTFSVAVGLVRGFSLSEDDALAYISIYNERCVPPWKPKDLAHKIKSATKSTKPAGYLL